MEKPAPIVNLIVESYTPPSGRGLDGKMLDRTVRVRPVPGSGYDQNIHIECSKILTENYMVGTRFEIRVQLTKGVGGGEYLNSNPKWPYRIMK